MVKKNNLYKKSIETKNIDDIRLYRNNRNNYYKEIKQAKTKYFTNIFTDNNKKGGETEVDDNENLYKANKMWLN